MNNQVPQLTSDEWYVYLSINRLVGVYELSAMTGFSEAEVAEHLATLEEQGLINSEDRQGTVGYQRTSVPPDEVLNGNEVLNGHQVVNGHQVANGHGVANGSAAAHHPERVRREEVVSSGVLAGQASSGGEIAGGGVVDHHETANADQVSNVDEVADHSEVANLTQPASPSGAAGPRSGSYVADTADPPPEDDRGLAGLFSSFGATRGDEEADRGSPPFRKHVSRAALAVALLAILGLVSALLLAASRDRDVEGSSQNEPGALSETGETRQTPIADSASASAPSGSASARAPTTSEIQLGFSSYTGEPFESVPIEGTYVGVQTGTSLRVQRLLDGEWVSFPLPAVTDDEGSFSTVVQLGAGRYRLRIADPESGAVSDEISVRIG
jgi:hypothetical protein